MRTQLYRHFNAAGELLYVGISINAARRSKEHNKSSWFGEVSRIEIEWFETRESALKAEISMIRTEKPKYNIVGMEMESIEYANFTAEQREAILNCPACAAKRETKRLAQARWRSKRGLTR